MQSIIWIFWFLVGHAIHMNMKITELMGTTKKTYLVVLEANAAVFLYRSFAGVAIFYLFMEGHLATLVAPLNIPLPAWAVVVMKWPMNWAIAGLCGLALDSLLGYIPGLKNLIPPEPGGGS